MTNKEQVKYKIGQKIVVKAPITINNITKNMMYIAIIRATPEESGRNQPAFSINKIGISYSVLVGSMHLRCADWILVGNLNNFTKLRVAINNFLISRRKYV